MRYQIKDLQIDTLTRTVTRGAEEIVLPDLSYDVLVYLAECAPEPASPAGLASAVWKAEHVSDETIAQRIKLLRKALGDTSRASRYIRTARGIGYAMAAPVTQIEKDKAFLSRRFAPALSAVATVVILLSGWSMLNKQHQSLRSEPTRMQTVAASEADTMVRRAREMMQLHQATGTSHAITMLRSVLEKYPDHVAARLALSFALTTKATKFDGDITHKQEAETLARAVIGAHPNNSDAWSALAYSVGSQGRSDEAIASYEYAIQLNPENVPAISSVAYEYLMRGQLHHALVMEQRAYKTAKHSLYSEIQIAQVLELIGHPAYKSWQARAFALNPGHVIILSELARSHIRRGDLHAALAALDQVDEAGSLAPQILQLRGRIAVMQGDDKAAREYFVKAGQYTHKDLAALNASHDDQRAGGSTLAASNEIFKMVSVSSPDTHIPFA